MHETIADRREPLAQAATAPLRSALDQAIKRAEDAEYLLHNAGIVEISVRNPSVADYARHWEGRAEKAEAALARARKALAPFALPAETADEAKRPDYWDAIYSAGRVVGKWDLGDLRRAREALAPAPNDAYLAEVAKVSRATEAGIDRALGSRPAPAPSPPLHDAGRMGELEAMIAEWRAASLAIRRWPDAFPDYRSPEWQAAWTRLSKAELALSLVEDLRP